LHKPIYIFLIYQKKTIKNSYQIEKNTFNYTYSKNIANY